MFSFLRRAVLANYILHSVLKILSVLVHNEVVHINIASWSLISHSLIGISYAVFIMKLFSLFLFT